MSSQAVGPFPHLGPEVGQIAITDEESAFPNYTETGWGWGPTQLRSRGNRAWDQDPWELGVRMLHISNVKGSGCQAASV